MGAYDDVPTLFGSHAMNKPKTRCGIVAAGLMSALALGCDDGAGGHVGGTVMFNGQMVKSGRVTLIPDGGGPTGYAPIVDGKFDTKEGSGTKPGKVTLIADGYGDPAPGYPNGVPLFFQYEQEATITGETTNFELSVPGSAAVRLPATPPEGP